MEGAAANDASSRRRGTTEVTRLLKAFGNGDPDALDDLIPLVYDTLRRVARKQLRGERPNHTLSTTGLVHESYLELVKIGEIEFQDRGHFFAAAARMMRHILIDHAVRKKALKRGGDRDRVALEAVVLTSDEQIEDVIALNQALNRLEEVDERLVRVVECRFFAALTIGETAEALEISEATVSRDWTRARAWLNRELADGTSI